MVRNESVTKLAPIALFVFKRPEHTLQTLNSLAANPEFIHSPLYIYCDGARNDDDSSDVECTRNIVRNYDHPKKIIIEQDKNRGLAHSVIAGVSELINKFGCIIVVEDDLVVSENFLSYLNFGLNQYKDIQKVMQISAYMFPVQEFAEKKEILFLPFISSWGWATWDRAWKNFDVNALNWELLLTDRKLRQKFDVSNSYGYSDMLLRQMSGGIDSWAIRWNWSIFQCEGLVVYPPVSLVKNAGFDGSGTHCGVNSLQEINTFNSTKNLKYPECIEISLKEIIHVRLALLALSGTYWIRILKSIRSYIRLVYMRVCA